MCTSELSAPPGTDQRTITDSLASMADPTRLELLTYLLETDAQPPYAVADIATRLDLDDAERLSLHHVHLPTLADANLIHWNRSDAEIHPGSALPAVRDCLETIEGST